MVMVEPKHTLSGPPTGNGASIRNTDLSTLQPVGKVYVMIAVSSSLPVARPVDGSIIRIDVSELLHAPPAGLLV
jgi:hypothetical protein